MCRPLTKVKFKAKLYPLSRSFQWYVTRHLNENKYGIFFTFIGRESNWQFDYRPFFKP